MTRVVLKNDDHRIIIRDSGLRGPQGQTGPQGPPGTPGDNTLPTGGTTGQVVRKASNADYDFEYHTPTKSDIGLGNVDNTSDIAKPISTAQQAALDQKVGLSGSQTIAGAKTFSPGAFLDAGNQVFDIRAFGAVGSNIIVGDGAISASTNTLTSASGLFLSTDVGKRITVDGAFGGGTLITTVASYVSPTQVTVTLAATTTVSAASVAVFRSNDTAAIQAACDAAINAGGGTVYIPRGLYAVHSTITLSFDPKIRIKGDAFIKSQSGTDSGSAIIAGATLDAMFLAEGVSEPTVNADLTHGILFEHITLDGANITTDLIRLSNSDFFALDYGRLRRGTNSINTVWDSSSDPVAATIPGGMFVSNSIISANNGIGINLQYNTQCWFTNLWFSGSSVSSWIVLKGNTKIKILDCEFNTATNGLLLQDSATFFCSDIVVTGCIFAVGAGNRAWKDERTHASSKRVSIVGNVIGAGVIYDTLANSPNVVMNTDSMFVSGPTATTDNALARFDGTNGRLVQNSKATLNDDGGLVLNNDGTDNALYIQQDGSLADNKRALFISQVSNLSSALKQAALIYTNTAHTAGYLLDIRDDNASSTLTAGVHIQQDGASTNGALHIVNTNNGRSLNIDQNGNSASSITGFLLDVDNADVGGAIALDIASASALGGTVVGMRIAAPIGGSSNYALQLSDTGGTSGGGITFGIDTNLYRSTSNTLKTDDTLIVSSRLSVGASPTTSAPFNSHRFQIADDDGSNSDLLFRVAGGASMSLNGAQSGGTVASPSTSALNTGSMVMRSWGYGATNYKEQARIYMGTDTSGNGASTPSDTSMPGTIVLYTTPNASTTVTERLRITNSGYVGINHNTPPSKFSVDGSTSFSTATKTSNYTLAEDHTVLADATSGSLTMTLPSVTGKAGRVYEVKKTDSSSNTVTVATTSSQTIDGATTYVLSAQNSTVRVMANALGTAWNITGASPGGVPVGTTDTQTLTNKRITPRVSSAASSSTPTPNADTDDQYVLTALAADATFGAPSGTPTNGQKLIVRIKDNGTARALSFNAIYRFSTDLVAPTTTSISQTLYMGFIYNGTDTKWDCIAKLGGFS